uniref:DUF4134 domain-containing protein n=1 Tax=Steinernema glaseri TaxID=37863 RepID=A0A1I8AUE4_9BILA
MILSQRQHLESSDDCAQAEGTVVKGKELSICSQKDASQGCFPPDMNPERLRHPNCRQRQDSTSNSHECTDMICLVPFARLPYLRAGRLFPILKVHRLSAAPSLPSLKMAITKNRKIANVSKVVMVISIGIAFVSIAWFSISAMEDLAGHEGSKLAAAKKKLQTMLLLSYAGVISLSICSSFGVYFIYASDRRGTATRRMEKTTFISPSPNPLSPPPRQQPVEGKGCHFSLFL